MSDEFYILDRMTKTVMFEFFVVFVSNDESRLLSSKYMIISIVSRSQILKGLQLRRSRYLRIKCFVISMTVPLRNEIFDTHVIIAAYSFTYRIFVSLSNLIINFRIIVAITKYDDERFSTRRESTCNRIAQL